MTAAAFAAAATLVSFAFGLSTLERWLGRGRDHELAWTVALFLFAVASGALWAGTATGWTGPLFRVFYLCGAIANVTVLAFGTLLLLAAPRARRWTWAVVAFVAFSAGVIAVAPFDDPVPPTGLPTGRELFGPLPRILASVASIGGAAVLIGGAAWTVARLLRRGAAGSDAERRLVLANLLIVAGVLVLGAGGAALEDPTPFAVTTTVGIVVIFAGFLVTNPRPTTQRKRKTN